MKLTNLEVLRERARSALRDLYHNATLDCYRIDLRGRTEEYFGEWLRSAAESEIEYLKDGGASPGDYRATLAAPCNAGRYKSKAAQAYYVRKGLQDRDEERADCGALTGWKVLERAVILARGGAIRMTSKTPRERHNAQWERISEYGALYQWGRGGATLAPDGCILQRGGSGFSIREDMADEMPARDVVDLVRVLESFNRHVAQWCSAENIKWMWTDHCDNEDAEERAAKRKAREQAKEESRRAVLARCFC